MSRYTVVRTRESRVMKKYLVRIRNVNRPMDIYDIQMAANNMSEVVAKAYNWLSKTTYKDDQDEIVIIQLVE